MTEPQPEDILESVTEQLDQLVAEGKITTLQARMAVEDILHEMTVTVYEEIYKNIPKYVSKREREDRGFLTRHKRHWGKPFKLLKALVIYAEDVGSSFNNKYRQQAFDSTDYKFEAMVGLHARSILIANEILCLLESGLADGAFSRWRSLHELSVVGACIFGSDQEVAKRYLLNVHVQNYYAMRQHQKHHKKANLGEFSKEEIEHIEVLFKHVQDAYPGEVKGDYWWCKPVIKKDKPNFADIEECNGMDHWRPRYKWASQYIHGNFKPHHTLLGMAGENAQVMLVGLSNRGLTDPAHSMAISLIQITSALILQRPITEHIVMARALQDLCEKVGEAFLSTERRLTRLHEKRLQREAAKQVSK
ncbi:DUF5677 domain-containing protein [Ferrovibrio sp. MS7]|uniref:DUF5677 domain-containing protein n=1 Tax=Ferrovibrio plantarum TaxID=3119164 RepID=UPI003135CBD1